MAKGLNLRAIFTADTKDIESGSKRATQSIKTFDKESSRLLENFGSMLGVNTGKIGAMAQAIEGFGVKAANSAGTSGKSIAKIASAFKILGGVIGGVAAVGTALWRSLNSEAEYYGSTLNGLADNRGIKTYQETLKQLRHEHRDGAGIQGFVNRIKRGWALIGTYLQAVFQSGGEPDKFMEHFSGDKNKAGRAEELARQLAKLDEEEIRNRAEISKKDAQIAEARLIVYDAESGIIERQRAAGQLATLINEKADIQLKTAQRRLELQRELNAITDNGLQDLEAEVSLEEAVNAIERNRSTELKSIMRDQRKLAKDTESWLESIDRMAYDESLASLEVEVELLDQQLLDDIEALGPEIDAEIQALNASLKPVELKVDTLPAVKIMDMLPILEQGFKQTFENIGTYIGNGLSGGGWAAEDLSSMMLSTLGDMAIKVGELAISTGVALSGIQAALKSMNPYLAIAAGAALVALGAAVKAGAANIANGGGYSSASVSSSYGSYSGDNYATREISVNVTGTLVANGSQLVAVLNNENKRKSLTT